MGGGGGGGHVVAAKQVTILNKVARTI